MDLSTSLKTQRVEEMVRLGARVRELREERGLTQKQLSDDVGLHRVNISKFENGKADIGVSRVRALAHALGVEPGRLFDAEPSDGTSQASPTIKPSGR